MIGVADLAALTERFTEHDGVHPTAVSGLTLYRASARSEPVAVVYEPSVCLVAQGAKWVTLGDEVRRYDPAHALLVSVDLPVTGQVIEASAGRPFLAVKVPLDLGVVGELAAAGPPEPFGGLPERGLAVGPSDPPLVDAAARLVALLAAPRDVPALAPLVLREIAYRLLAGPHGRRLRQMAAGDGHARRVGAAVGWLRHHFREPLRVADLARRARMSPSAFHAHFKAVTALSPVQYQKRLRLEEARRLLLGDGLDAAEAGFRVGYESPSQFSREYRRLFGTPPARDAATRRAGLAAAG